ncbi:vitelline membrane outer layer protein 1 homolog [Cherax quadricarinatus]|uniref:vitelline membrane outer layer protein 1 homolog n=1 Tax=Cherax quadricarinatus TaxID=27406 RepID=UPI00387EBE5C
MGRSCLMNLLTSFSKTFEAVDHDTEFDIIYLDFSKAFDRVPHKRLLKKVATHGTGEKVLSWIESWLTNGKQRVCTNGYAPYAGVNLAVDDCGVSGIKLLCMTQQGMQTTSILFNQNYILNAQQGTATCSNNTFVKDIRARFHLTTGSEDRDALNQVLFRCQDSTQLSSYTSNDTGTWGVWTSCVPGSVMCGARVMYQPVSALSDNTCFNEILMLCCFL